MLGLSPYSISHFYISIKISWNSGHQHRTGLISSHTPPGTTVLFSLSCFLKVHSNTYVFIRAEEHFSASFFPPHIRNHLINLINAPKPGRSQPVLHFWTEFPSYKTLHLSLLNFALLQHCCYFTSVSQWANTFLLFLLVVYILEELFLVVFDSSGQFQFR